MIFSPTAKRTLFGITIDALTLDQAVAAARRIIADGRPDGCPYVVTPNVAHVVMLQQDRRFRQAYRGASLVLADGKPLIGVSRLVGQPLPERIAGSDFVPALLDAMAKDGLSLFLLGAGPGVAERAAQNIVHRYPGVRIAGCYSPPFGFETDPDENRRIVARINAAGPQLLVIGLGAPKQELWICRHAAQLRAGLAVCAGATIDFMAGHKARAPRWVQNLSLEWLYRMACEPRRLSGRYIGDALRFPMIVAREVYHRRQHSGPVRRPSGRS